MQKYNLYDKFRISERDIFSLGGEIRIFHSGISDGNYAIAGEEIIIECAFPRVILAKEAKVLFYDGYNGEFYLTAEGKVIKSDLEFDYFRFSVKSLNSIGLYFFYFEINTQVKLYGCKLKNNFMYFSFTAPSEQNRFQITVTKEENGEKIPGIIYHIFVDRFRRAKNTPIRDGAVLIENWNGPITEYPKYPGAFLKNNTFFGGNLYGVIEKLDYLCELGVSVIYLSPIFESPSNHKYDTADYENVDTAFGGDEAFEELVEKARERNIKIILDGVFNHTGADSKYFNKFSNYDFLGAFQSKKSPYYSWYRFTEYPNKYECWWGIDILPRIFYESGDAEKYFLSENGVIEKWMKKGAYGFRLDVADELSDSFIEKIRSKISGINNNALLYGEVWEDASNKVAYGVRKKYYLGSELTGIMNYPLRVGIIDYIRNKTCSKLDYAVNEVIFNMPKKIREKAMNILGSHDTVRIISALSKDSADYKTNDELATLKMSEYNYEIAKKRVISAYTLLTALPGIPTVYYGDEAGVEGYSDPFNRKTFPWGFEDEEILNHYKKCGMLRKENISFYDGDFHVLHLDNDLFIFERKKENERFLTVYNNSMLKFKVKFSIEVREILTGENNEEFLLIPEKAYIFTAEWCKFKIWYYNE